MSKIEFKKEEVAEGLGIFVAVHTIDERRSIVVDPITKETFIWLKDEEAVDPNMDGVRIHFNSEDVEKVVELAKLITGVE